MKITRRKLHHNSSDQQQQNMIRILTVGAGSFFLLVVLFLAWNLPSGNSTGQQHHRIADSNNQTKSWRNILAQKLSQKRTSSEPHRLALLLPFVGEDPASVPVYLHLFCRGASAASDVADFFLIHNGVLSEAAEELHFCATAKNVIFVNLESTKAVAERLLRVLEFKTQTSEPWKIPKGDLVKLLTRHLDVYPYTLVEYKPAYGYIFQDLVPTDSYTHWGYTDLDMVFGDLGRHIEESEWRDYDLVTFGFGDQQRLYVKGQFTMHRNTDQVRQLWRGCDYLSKLDERFARMIQKKEKVQLESAEGCYPATLMKNKNISIKFAVKAWTDVSKTDTAYAHGVYLYQHPKHPYKHVLAKALDQDLGENGDELGSGSLLPQLPQDWFLKDLVYKDQTQPLYTPIGAMEPVELPKHHSDEKVKCMFWVQQKYQKNLCLNDPISSDENVFWVKGKLYKQAFTRTPLQNEIDTGPFFHFQEWKRRYRFGQIAALDNPGAEIAVLLPEGGIAVSTAPSKRKGWKQRRAPHSPLGLHLDEWTGVVDKKEPSKEDRSQLPLQRYCLSGESDHFQFHLECDPLISWRGDKFVEMISKAPAWNQFSADSDVTLVQTLQIHTNGETLDSSINTVKENILRWHGQPAVVVIYVSPLATGAVDRVKAMLPSHETCLIGLIAPPKPGKNDEDEDFVVSSKALQNMAIDVAPTRWYLSGLQEGRSVLSRDVVQLARRAASLHQSLPGNIFYVPQFALPETHGWNLAELVESKNKHQIQMLDDVNECEDDSSEQESDALSLASVIWWNQTLDLLDENKEEASPSDVAEAFQELEYRLVDDLKQATKKGFVSGAQNALLLVDNQLGHGTGQHAHIVAREVEEFGGGRCFNLLRLGQLIMFGFELNVLEGAFAAISSRDGSKEGSLACTKCFFLDEDYGELRDHILRHEISRSLVSSGLWEQVHLQKST